MSTGEKEKKVKPPSNAWFSVNDTPFIEACRAAGLPATPRQASRFRRGKGLAFQNRIKEVTKK